MRHFWRWARTPLTDENLYTLPVAPIDFIFGGFFVIVGIVLTALIDPDFVYTIMFLPVFGFGMSRISIPRAVDDRFED